MVDLGINRLVTEPRDYEEVVETVANEKVVWVLNFCTNGSNREISLHGLQVQVVEKINHCCLQM